MNAKASHIKENCRVTLPKHFAGANVVIEETDVSYTIRKADFKPLLSASEKKAIEESLESAAAGKLTKFDVDTELEEFEQLSNS